MRNLSKILNTMRDGGLFPSIQLVEIDENKRIWEANISYGPEMFDMVLAWGEHPTDALAEAFYKLSEDIRAKVEI
jgi:hypothetical protein